MSNNINCDDIDYESVVILGESRYSINLKPCPFCGGKAELDSRRFYRNIKTGSLATEMAVYCLSCDADMSVCTTDVPDIQPEQMAEKWNTRTCGGTWDECN